MLEEDFNNIFWVELKSIKDFQVTEQIRAFVKQMIGCNLISHQTTKNKYVVIKVLVKKEQT